MKRSVFIIVLSLALFSCSKDELSRENIFVSGQEVTISVNSKIETRVAGTLNNTTDEIEFSWEEGDKVLVTVGGKSSEFTLTEGAGSANASFRGVMPAEGETFSIQFPAEQTAPSLESQEYQERSLPHNKMLARAENCKLDENITLVAQNAALRVNFFGGKTVSKIVLTDMSSSENPKPQYTLSCGTSGVVTGDTEAEATPFFMVMPVGTMAFKVEVFDNKQTPKSVGVFETTSPKTFTASQVLNLTPAKKLSYAIPTGAMNGEFTVSTSPLKKVRFAKGNLQATYSSATSSYSWGFASHQYEFLYDTSGNQTIASQTDGAKVDFFGWSTPSTYYGINTSENASDYVGAFKDWGTAIDGDGTWYTLSQDEWFNIFENRNVYTIEGNYIGTFYAGNVIDGVSVTGLFLFPDDYTGTSDMTSLTWSEIDGAGILFLPVAGQRFGSGLANKNIMGQYWMSNGTGGGFGNVLYITSWMDIRYEGHGSGVSVGNLVRLATEA